MPRARRNAWSAPWAASVRWEPRSRRRALQARTAPSLDWSPKRGASGVPRAASALLARQHRRRARPARSPCPMPAQRSRGPEAMGLALESPEAMSLVLESPVAAMRRALTLAMQASALARRNARSASPAPSRGASAQRLAPTAFQATFARGAPPICCLAPQERTATRATCKAAISAPSASQGTFALRARSSRHDAARARTRRRRAASSASLARRARTRASRAQRRARSATLDSRAQRAPSCRSPRRVHRAPTST